MAAARRRRRADHRSRLDAGNPRLSEQLWKAALSASDLHCERIERLLALLDKLRARPTFTAEDRAQLRAAQAACRTALDEFARQVDAWIDTQEHSE